MELFYIILLVFFGLLFLVAELVLLPGVSVGALLALAQIVCLALCLLALVVLALCFLMASYPEECRQFWRMLRETRAEGRGNDS